MPCTRRSTNRSSASDCKGHSLQLRSSPRIRERPLAAPRQPRRAFSTIALASPRGSGLDPTHAGGASGTPVEWRGYVGYSMSMRRAFSPKIIDPEHCAISPFRNRNIRDWRGNHRQNVEALACLGPQSLQRVHSAPAIGLKR